LVIIVINVRANMVKHHSRFTFHRGNHLKLFSGGSILVYVLTII